jgi:hypothetical protein
VDLSNPLGQAVVRRLATDADVLIVELQGGGSGPLRSGLREPAADQSAPRLLLRDRLWARWPLPAPARLRRGVPGHERHDGRDR